MRPKPKIKMHAPFYKIQRIISIKKELGELYASLMIERFAIALVGIFIPVFLLEMGFSLMETLLFMGVTWISSGLFSPLSAKIDSRFGVKHVILYRAPILIVFFILLIALNSFTHIFFPLAVLGGVSLALYWISMNGQFVKNADKIHGGEDVGLYFGLEKVPGIIAPAIGAILLSVMGFDFLFILVVLLILISVFPLFLSRDFKPIKFKFKNFKIMLEEKMAMYFFIIGGFQAGDMLIWGLFVYFNFGVISLGLASSLTGLAMALFTIWFGKLSNVAKNRTRLLRSGVMLFSLLWITRAFVTTELEVFLISFLSGLLFMTLEIPVFSTFTEHARDRDIIGYVGFRNLWQNLGRVAIVMVSFVSIILLGNTAFVVSFYVLAGLCFLMLTYR